MFFSFQLVEFKVINTSKHICYTFFQFYMRILTRMNMQQPCIYLDAAAEVQYACSGLSFGLHKDLRV